MTAGLRIALGAVVLIVGIGLATSVDQAARQDAPPPVRFDPTQAPAFAISIAGNAVTIRGVSVSAEHADGIEQLADFHLRDRSVAVALEPGVALPPVWRAITLRLIYASAALASGDLQLSDAQLRIRGVTQQPAEWQERLNFLRRVVPTAIDLDIEVLQLPATAATPVLCARAFAAALPAGVEFSQSSATIRSASYAALDRLADLAARCPEARLGITGHTDNAGDPQWNQELSRLRAEAVAEYLGQRGMAANRLEVAGAGAAEPLVSNDTAAGRKRNRRIEIEVRF